MVAGGGASREAGQPVDDGLRVERRGAVRLLTLARPAARNALDEALLRAIGAAVQSAAADEAVRSVVITGAGGRAFCAGADIRAMQRMTPADAVRWAALGQEVFAAVEALPKPVIAAVNGVAAGGGCELALACDYRILAAGAQLGQPEITLGLMPGWGGTYRLLRLIGQAAAADLILTGRFVGSAEAQSMGLAHRVVPDDAVVSESLALAERFAGLPPLAIGYAKRALRLAQTLSAEAAGALEANLFGLCFATEDRAEGLAAFLEKRRPAFRGR